MPLEILHRAAPCRNVPVTFTLERIEAMVIIATVAGLALGLLLALVVAAPVVRGLSVRSARPQWIRRAAVLGALLAAAPAFFLAIVVGGNFGGAWGDLALGSAGVPLGLGLGAALVFGVGLALGASLFALVLRAGLHLVGRRNAL